MSRQLENSDNRASLDDRNGSTENKISIIASLCEEIGANIEIEKIVASVYQHIIHLMPVDAFFIGIFDERKQDIEFELAIEANQTLPKFSIPLSDKLRPAIWCLNNKAPLIINNFELERTNEEIAKLRPVAPMENTRVESMVYWPLLVGSQVVGLLSVQSYEPNAYSEACQQIMKAIANTTAIALNNASSYQEVEKQKSSVIISDKYVQIISEIGREINSTLNLETVLWTVYQHVNKLMDATVFGIGLYDAEEELIRIDLAMEKGKRYKPYTRTMEIKNQFPVWCIENRDVVFINDIRKQGGNYFETNEYDTWEQKRVVLEDDAFSGKPVSLIYVPMMLNDLVYGFITVQSFKIDVYKDIHVDILKSIAGYTVNAIANARAHQQLKETQESLQAAKKEAEKIADSKIRFLANMSHEIRTPMNIVLGFMGVVLDDNKLSTEDEQYINTAHTAAKNLLTIIDDILDITKNESGKLKLESAPFDLYKLLLDAGQLLSFQAKEKGIDYEFNFDEALTHCYEGDFTRINQIILNLAGNAIKFTNKGKIKVTVSPDVDSSSLLFAVSDTGVGIAIEKQSQIFEVFTQADTSTTRQFGGSGLGTTICRQLVEAMNGKIWVESELGKGSTFYFCLPLKPVDDFQVNEDSYLRNKQVYAPRELKILLAEDTAPNAFLMNVALKKKGHQLTVVDNGLKALQAVEAESFDLILMDVQMPTMDGLNATRKIRKLEEPDKKSIPIIAMTASALPEDRQACFEAGMDSIHPKPVNFEELFLLMSELTENSDKETK